jgi:hypothetical protein
MTKHEFPRVYVLPVDPTVTEDIALTKSPAVMVSDAVAVKCLPSDMKSAMFIHL